ncbi:hypothetical protein K438DRAFT_1795525 [Mycena galopus ATCC 62051]|nr:hypothetical protein K438DRAFT_1795525 [Mycena galopus ATCC 62051]
MAPGIYSGCNLCLRAIAPTDARVQCLECHEYDLCANCAIGAEEFEDEHLPGHRTRVFRKSGGGALAPVVSLSTTIVYRIPEAVEVDVIQPLSPPLTASPSFAPPSTSQASPDPPLPALPEMPVPSMYTLTSTPTLPPAPPPIAQQPVPPPHSPAPSMYALTSTPTLPPAPAPIAQQPVPPPHSPAPMAPILPPRQSTVVQPRQSMTMQPRRSTNLIISSLPQSAYTTSASAAMAALAQIESPCAQAGNNITTQPQFPRTVIPQTVTTEGGVSALTMPPRYSPPQVQAAPQYPAHTGTSQGGVSAYTMPPRDNSRPQTPRMISSPQAAPPGPPPPPPIAWGPFFDADMSPTPVFMELINAIFTYLDTQRTGNLTPEVYSRFLINQGYVGNQNIWHSNLVASLGKTKEENADAALKRAFDLFGIQYVLRPRVREATSPPADVKQQLQSFGASFARALSPAAPVGGAMPLLTRVGFLSITSVEVLCDPSRHHTGLARIVQMYDLSPVRAWGALPRGVLPDEADPRMLARIARVQAAARERRQSSQSQVLSGAASAAGGLRTAAAFAQNAVSKIDAKETVNAINAMGDVLYIVNSVSNSN